MAMPMDKASVPAAVMPRSPAVRNVVEGDGQYQHGGPFQPSMGSFRLRAVLVQMGNRPVQNQQEQDAQPKADHRREKRPPTHPLRLFHSGDKQVPDRRRHHDARCKAGQGPLDHRIHSSF